MRSPFHNQHGTTLMETILAVAIFSMVATALTSMVYIGVLIIRDDQSRLDGLAIAQSQIETIRNVPYDNIGTIGGVPSGSFEQITTQTLNERVFSIETDIRYVDDPFDGVAPTDTVNTDYKKVRVEVSWEGQYLDDPVILITTIVPDGIETTVGGGTLWVEVYDADAEPVVGATVAITNPTVVPIVNLNSTTDANGRVILPGASPSVQSYHIEVSKAGFSSAQTYAVDPVNNPNPDPGDQTVVEDGVTTITFFIDELSDLQLTMVDVDTGTPIVNLPVQVTGDNRIGTDLSGADIPEYDQSHTSAADGLITLTDLEYDTYQFVVDDAVTGFDFAGSTPHVPHVLAPNVSDAVSIAVAPDAAQTLLITVEDAGGIPVENASVHVFNVGLAIDLTQTTNTSGQTFFTPLGVGTFAVEVSATGFELYNDTVDIADDEQQVIPMISL